MCNATLIAHFVVLSGYNELLWPGYIQANKKDLSSAGLRTKPSQYNSIRVKSKFID